ncbi:low density lipoprotein receptor adapter protein, putative, partial [Ixodes scapularis]
NQSGQSRRQRSMEGYCATDEATLPGCFIVKYLGVQDATGLWGLKHTRRAVDELVSAAKNAKLATLMPMVKLEVSDKGVTLVELSAQSSVSCVFPIESISYGVQDVSYSKVVAMIVVRESPSALQQHEHPFRCHAFVCESKAIAKRLTLTLAAAFKEFSKMVKTTKTREMYTKKFAIDLRGEDDGECVPEDSEA